MYLYEGRLASISLVFWAVVPLSDESCESSLSDPWAFKKEIQDCYTSNCLKWHNGRLQIQVPALSALEGTEWPMTVQTESLLEHETDPLAAAQ